MDSERRDRWILAAEDAVMACLVSIIRGSGLGMLELTAARINGRRKERRDTMVKLVKGYQDRIWGRGVKA